ncbi:MAG: DNA repair protein RecN [Clostridia bacterium]
MLVRLFAENIALIDSLEVEFDKSFNCLTGETGAGKSIIIGALNLALGERFRSEHIKFGKAKARVELLFDVSNDKTVLKRLNELEIDVESGELYISRDFSRSGKSISRLNGEIVTLAALKSISDLLVDVHGQHEHQSLLQKDNHIGFLDAFSHTETAELKRNVAQAAEKCEKLSVAMHSGFISEAERARRIDMLTYQIEEISRAKLKSDDEDKLNRELALLSNAEKINTALNSAYNAISIDMGAKELLSVAMNDLSSISAYDPEYDDLYNKLSEAYYTLEEISYSISNIKDNVLFDEKRLNVIERRLDLITGLKKKYGATLNEVIAFFDNLKIELTELKNGEETRLRFQTALEESKDKYYFLADQLSAMRKSTAIEFSESVMKELSDLGLSGAQFSVRFIEGKKIIAANGYDDVEFFISTNRGDPEKPLAKVASGGEVSRIMLALKSIMAEKDSISTMIFDEIDTGISGKIATIVGNKMKNISKTHQLIVITHLPQIAAKAKAHFLVEKHDGEAVSTTLRKLALEERYIEIARIMGGEDSMSARAHARELIEN